MTNYSSALGPKRPQNPTDDISSQLDDYLGALRHDESLLVDEMLASTPWESTERVFFVGCDGAERGPYIRKVIQRDSGLGKVYRMLYQARLEGRRFRSLPAVLDCRDEGERTVVLMEYARGIPLRELVLKTDQPRREELARSVFPALLDAAGELHGAFDTPVVHRDLTPTNVVCPEDHPEYLTLIDFGISRRYDAGASSDTTHFGTRSYAPPEQYGFGQTDVRSDVYALGATLFFMLTGRDPQSSDREAEWRDPNVSEGMRLVIKQACALNPGARFCDTAQMKTAFCNAKALGHRAKKKAADTGAADNARDPKEMGIVESIGRYVPKPIGVV